MAAGRGIGIENIFGVTAFSPPGVRTVGDPELLEEKRQEGLAAERELRSKNPNLLPGERAAEMIGNVPGALRGAASAGVRGIRDAAQWFADPGQASSYVMTEDGPMFSQPDDVMDSRQSMAERAYLAQHQPQQYPLDGGMSIPPGQDQQSQLGGYPMAGDPMQPQEQAVPHYTPEQQAEIEEGTAAGERFAHEIVDRSVTQMDPMVAAAATMAAERAAMMDLMGEIQERGMKGLEDASVRIKAAYDKADLEMSQLKVDPRRWEKETPAMTQALLLMASTAFGFITKGQGPNPILQIMDRAIQRDTDAQVTNYELAMKRAGLQIKSVEEQEYARQKIQTALWSRAVHSLNAMTENSRSELQLRQLSEGARLSQQQLQVQWQKLYQDAYRTQLAASGAAGPQAPTTRITPKFVQDYATSTQQALGGYDLLDRMGEAMAEGKSNNAITRGLSRVFGGTDSVGDLHKEYEAVARAVQRALGFDKGNLALKEAEALLNSMAGVNWIDKFPQQYRTMTKVMDRLRVGLDDTVKNLGPNGEALIPMQQSLNEKHKHFSSRRAAQEKRAGRRFM